MARRRKTDGMEQLRAILLWAVAISIAVIIAGVATGAMTFRGEPPGARSLPLLQDSAIG